MNLNDLFAMECIDSEHVLVLRHRPPEPELNKVLPWLAAERPDLFNAYQQTQQPMLEGAMQKMAGTGYVASFIGHEAGKALFVGLYSISGSKPLTREEYWQVPACIELKAFGMKAWEARKAGRWFDLRLTGFYCQWKGKLVVGWPGPEHAWWRRAHRNEFPVLAVLEDSALDGPIPEWHAINLTWEELGVLPKRIKVKLCEWRGIYYILDTSDGKGYVGSAYGESNLLGRWQDYAAKGHGDNRLLRRRDPRNFRFTILQRPSPDMEKGDVEQLEASWKRRLHTRAPHGLNGN